MQTRLTTERMMDATLAFSRLDRTLQIHEQMVDIQCKVKVFEAVVWFPLLQPKVNATGSRGMSGECGGVKLMTWCCAGRCLIQLQSGDHRLTLITADDEKPWARTMAHVAPNMGPMGVQSIDADYVEALKMLYVVTRWRDEITLADDDNVSIG